MENRDYTYEITGRTTKDKFVCIGVGSLDFVIQYFIEKYPRFKGKATVYKVFGTRENGLFMSNYHDKKEVFNFNDTTELKEMIKQPESFKEILEEFSEIFDNIKTTAS